MNAGAVDGTLAALADPTRRGVVDLLRRRPRPAISSFGKLSIRLLRLSPRDVRGHGDEARKSRRDTRDPFRLIHAVALRRNRPPRQARIEMERGHEAPPLWNGSDGLDGGDLRVDGGYDLLALRSGVCSRVEFLRRRDVVAGNAARCFLGAEVSCSKKPGNARRV